MDAPGTRMVSFLVIILIDFSILQDVLVVYMNLHGQGLEA